MKRGCGRKAGARLDGTSGRALPVRFNQAGDSQEGKAASRLLP